MQNYYEGMEYVMQNDLECAAPWKRTNQLAVAEIVIFVLFREIFFGGK